MVSATTSCFQEDATCVIVSESFWRLQLRTGGGTATNADGKESCMDQLLYFLGRALVLTRRTLYVLVCVAPGANAASNPVPASGQRNAGCGSLFEDAAALVSCGPEAWHFCMWLNAKLGDLARRLELTVSPIVIPWETEVHPDKQMPRKGATGNCRPWVLRARAAVIRHYLLTLSESLWWQAKDEAVLTYAVPLVVDGIFAFTSREVCALWSRHCHINPLHATLQTCQLDVALTCSADDTFSSTTPNTLALSKKGRHEAESRATRKACASFKYTVVAGTFDRLHAGHKLLLAASALATNETIGLAVAAGPLISKKVIYDDDMAAAGIQPFSYRLQVAVAFLQLLAASRGRDLRVSGFNEAIEEEERSLSGEQQLHAVRNGRPSTVSGCLKALLLDPIPVNAMQSSGPYLQLQVFRLTDPVGPADRLAFDCLVVSADTLKGANAVNGMRMKLGNDPVSLLIVELVPTDAQTTYVAEALEAILPFPSGTGGYKSKKEPSSNTPSGDNVNTAPAEQAKTTAAAAAHEDVNSSADRRTLAYPGMPTDACHSKLSSTELRHRQCIRLRCDSISWLCSRFRSAWFWLMGREDDAQTIERQSATNFWHLLCAEHASPWRRLHTFERLEQGLKRLDEDKPCVRAEPVMLCLFLGSLLACPCRCLTLSTRLCDASGSTCRINTLIENQVTPACTVANWTPAAEGESWQKAAKSLLAELQSNPPIDPSNEQATKKPQSQLPMEERAAANSCFPIDGSTLSGRYSLLMDLLCEHHAASLATLGTTPRPADMSQRDASTYTSGNTTPPAEDIPALVRLARRIEQLVSTDGALTLTARLQGLREEYFFVEDTYFNTFRRSQLIHVLENADTFGALAPQELLSATTTVKQELELLRRMEVAALSG